MRLEREWAEAAFPPEVTVLNLRLRPYCCGHELTLSQAESPFLLGHREPQFKDLMLAALVCSQSFTQGRKILTKPNGGGIAVSLWGCIARRTRHAYVEETKFIEYLERGTWSPATAKSVGKGVSYRELKAPRVWRLVPFLCNHVGLTEAQAWDYPIARANALYAAELDRAGSIDLAGGRVEDSLMQHLADLEARAAKGENVWEF